MNWSGYYKSCITKLNSPKPEILLQVENFSLEPFLFNLETIWRLEHVCLVNWVWLHFLWEFSTHLWCMFEEENLDRKIIQKIKYLWITFFFLLFFWKVGPCGKAQYMLWWRIDVCKSVLVVFLIKYVFKFFWKNKLLF